MKKLLSLFALSLLSFLWLQGQQPTLPLLEREVTIRAENQSIELVLNEISKQAGFVFSYSPDAYNYQNKTTIRVVNKPVKLVLSYIFNDEITYKAKGKYIILRKNPSSQKVVDKQTIEGYVFDTRSGEKLTEASIYTKGLLVSTVTDQYGYFKMEVPSNTPLSAIRISKLGYTDTLLASQFDLRQRKMMEITLNLQDSAIKKSKTTGYFQKFFPKWLIPRKIRIHSLNLNDSIFRKVQFSFLPMVSTNLFLTGNIENDVSFNTTVGYVYGIRKAEFGGIINIVRTNAGVCQLAGVGNIVGGNFKGFQGAGVFNYAKSAKGVQSAGIFNTSIEKSNIQLAGVYNLTRKANVQAAGVLNLAFESNAQLSGILNVAGKVNIIQVTGLINYASVVNTQLSGLINKADTVKGLQIAGFINQAKVAAVQISGFINIASHLKGVQLSVINISDSCSGIPIGLFNYVKKGYHKLELSYDETSMAGLAFRTGARLFHSNVTAGIYTNQLKNELLTFGYGIGTSLGNPEKLLFDIDLSINQFRSKGDYSFNNNLYKIYLGVDRKIFNKMSIAAGLSFNMLTCDAGSPYYSEVYSKIPLYTIDNRTSNTGINVKTWIGAKVALRLF